MKKLAIVTLFVLGGFAVNAQTKPKTAATKAPAAKKECAMKGGKSCCQNEKALSALRRPTAKPVAKKS